MKVTKDVLKSLILEVKKELREDYYNNQTDFVVKGEDIMQEVQPIIDTFLEELMKKHGQKISDDYWFASALFAEIQSKTKSILGLK
tara:strand:+ start:545 stop:802 length:258 start_codon:yes stop_codon:yes gene_type:complete